MASPIRYGTLGSLKSECSATLARFSVSGPPAAPSAVCARRTWRISRSPLPPSLRSFLPLPASPPRFPAYCSPLSLSHSLRSCRTQTNIPRPRGERETMREESRVELLKESEAVGGRMRRMSSSNALCPAKNDRWIPLDFDVAQRVTRYQTGGDRRGCTVGC